MISPRHAAWLRLAPPGTYLVGGALRDRLLGKRPFDLDWVVPGESLAIAQQLALATDGHLVILDPPVGVARVVWDDPLESCDIVAQEGDAITVDLARRDLTINAMALPLSPESLAWVTGEINYLPSPGLIDPFGGQADVQQQIRAIREQNLLDDPLRLLRVFRFAASCGFQVDAPTLGWIRAHGARIQEVAPERVAHEVYELLAGRAAPVLKQMQACGFLLELWPEMRPMTEIPPNTHHHLDVLSHSVEVANQMERLLNGDTAFGVLDERLTTYANQELAHHRRIGPWLKGAALWHDLGKPATYTLDGDRPRFTGHDKVGAGIMVAMGERLRLSTQEIKWLETLVAQHLRPGHLLNAPLTQKALYRFYRELGDDAIGVALLAWADRLGTQGPAITTADNEAMLTMVRTLIDGYFNWAVPIARTPPLLDGRQLMSALGWQPGPHVGQMLARLREAQALGEVADADAALALARQLAQSPDE